MSSLGTSLGWSAELWEKINRSMREEEERTLIADKMIPVNAVSGAMTVASNAIPLSVDMLSVDEGGITHIVELTCQFSLTNTQVEQEHQMSTALTLATRAANLMSIAQDKLIFNDSTNLPKPVQVALNGNSGKGLLHSATENIPVKSTGTKGKKKTYGENTFAAVAEGIASLQDDGFYDQYGLVLPTEAFADINAPLPETLIMPRLRIKPLVPKGLRGTGILPKDRGLLFSVAATMDIIVGSDLTLQFLNTHGPGIHEFRLVKRLALRVILPAVKILEFG
jgi:uncharacterized linocin/CFP29 family protein